MPPCPESVEISVRAALTASTRALTLLLIADGSDVTLTVTPVASAPAEKVTPGMALVNVLSGW